MVNRILGLDLPARVRVARTRLTPAQMIAERAEGRLRATPLEPAELVVGGAVVATGTITEQDGRAVFTVEEVK